MNALQNSDQAAGNKWGKSCPPMMHEGISVGVGRDLGFTYANSMFEGFERQMRVNDFEFSNSVRTLRERYVFNDVGAVEYFVKTHRTVAPLLIEAAPQFAAAFGSKTPLALEIMPDDETPHSIYALAIWDGDVAEARSALRTFDDGWLAKNFHAINGRIVFDYELI